MSRSAEQLERLLAVMRQLLGEPGCPWDREQTHASLARYLLEETYEALEAIEGRQVQQMQEELGDVFFQVVFHAALAEQEGSFDLADVIAGVCDKMQRRHPHVFGDLSLATSSQVADMWEGLKKQEGKKTLLEGIPQALPALLRAHKLQEKAAGVGFDWPSSAGAWDKLREELAEYAAAEDGETRREELGDILFAAVNCARMEGILAEEALQQTNRKFIRRFAHIERQVQASGKNWDAFSLQELDSWWEEAKSQERQLFSEEKEGIT
jgi:tetrapyrrole methylase family protein/MazG family protein